MGTLAKEYQFALDKAKTSYGLKRINFHLIKFYMKILI